MIPKQPTSLRRLEHQAEELEKCFDDALAYHEKIESDKKLLERKGIEWGILEKHKADLEAAEERAPFEDSIAKIEAELLKQHEELKKLLKEEWPKEIMARDWARYEAEGLESRYRVLNDRIRNARLRLAKEALAKKHDQKESLADRQKRAWNEAIIQKEMSKLESEMKSGGSTSQKVVRFSELKEASARNQDTSQPPPTIGIGKAA